MILKQAEQYAWRLGVAEPPSDYSFHLVTLPYHSKPTSAAAYPPGAKPGGEGWHSAITWDDAHAIGNIETKPAHQGKGLATALYRWVKDNHVPDLIHAPARTEAGQGWAASTGDDLAADLAEYKRRRGY